MLGNSPFFILQDTGGDGLPATLTTPTDGATDINVLLSRERADSNLGGSRAENASASVAVQTKDVANLTLTTKGDTTLDISELLVNEEGEIIENETGEALYASAQYQYSVAGKYTDSDGITLFDLTEN